MRTLSATGKHVVVIGGGDTGSDCVGTSNKQKAKSVTARITKHPPERENKLYYMAKLALEIKNIKFP